MLGKNSKLAYMEECFKLQWTPTTLEFYSDEKKKGVFVFNFNIGTLDSRENALQFVCGKLFWTSNFQFSGNLELLFDVRGQAISEEDLKWFREQLLKKIDWYKLSGHVDVTIKSS
jgi:hypothetical protein